MLIFQSHSWLKCLKHECILLSCSLSNHVRISHDRIPINCWCCCFFSDKEPRTESLTVFKREEQSYYVFQQILETFFTDVPQSTVRRWLRNLGKFTVRTNSFERQHFNRLGLLPYRYLIHENDLRQLVEYSKNRRKYTKRKSNQICSPSSPAVSDTVSNIVPQELVERLLCDEMPRSNVSVSNSSSDDTANNAGLSEPVVVASSQTAGDDAMSNEIPTSHSVQTCTGSDDDDDDVEPQCRACSPEIPRPKKIQCLKDADTPSELRTELVNLYDFYTSNVNPLRSCSAFSASTMRKFKERVGCFLNFCRVSYPQRTLVLSLVDDVDIIQAYTNYQLEERKLNITTVVRTITALINLAKYVHRASDDLDTCVELVRLKNVQRQLSQKQHAYNLASKAGLCDNNGTSSFVFQHVLDTIKSLKEKVDGRMNSPQHTRLLHDFVMISLYITSMCGRSKELRTLELFSESVEGREFRFDWQRKCNVFVVSADGNKFTLYENDFKNLRSHGPSKFELNDSMWLIPYLKEYIGKRSSLLRGEYHPFMFMTVTGLAFTSPSFTGYLGDLFQREVNVRAGTTKLRHALVTYVLSLPQAESLRLRESLAVLMRHSLRHQQVTYCDISRQDKTSLSRDLVNKTVEQVATETVTEPDVRSSIKEDSRPCEEVSVGDMVALLDSVSTCAENAVIFVGRVLKIRDNDALLMEFSRVEGSETLYRSVVDSSWWDNLDSLIYPIDIVFDSKRQAYELRSTAADIFHAVHNI